MSAESRSGRDLPLIRWGQELRRKRARRRRLYRRASAVGLLVGLTGAPSVVRPLPLFVWNASASAPVGLYAVSPGVTPHIGDMVVATLPPPFARLAAERRYLPSGLPVVKRVAAASGDDVCAHDAVITLDGKRIADRRKRDGQGRPMPWWQGCRRLHDGEVLLLMVGVPTSFDGRYFGVTKASDIVGKAHLLWAR